LVALLKAAKQSCSFELFFYLGNYVEFAHIFQLLQNKQPLTRDTELYLAEYLNKIPTFYFSYVSSIFQERGYKREFKFKANPGALIATEALEKSQQQARRLYAELYKTNFKSHS
jgi:hypothetical protein